MRQNLFTISIGIAAAVIFLLMFLLFWFLPGGSISRPLEALPEGGYVDCAAGASLALSAVANQRELQHDNYAIYYDQDEFANLFRTVTGSYTGIGVYIADDEAGRAYIYGLMRKSPAGDAGIKPGDTFVRINSQEAAEMDSSAVVEIIGGLPKNRTITMVMNRPEVGEMTFEVKVTTIDLPTLDYKMLDETVGLIRIESFNSITGQQFDEAYDDLAKQGMQGLILDLRNNGGGEITSALHICDYFVPRGEPLMYITEPKGVYYYSAEKANVDTPLVILQNGNSASASEMLIGAVHDNGTATTIGETTFGKGIMQDLTRLDSGAGLRFTSAKYSTSHKHDIHGIGIEPDIYFPMPDNINPLAVYSMDLNMDAQLVKAMEVLQEKL